MDAGNAAIAVGAALEEAGLGNLSFCPKRVKVLTYECGSESGHNDP